MGKLSLYMKHLLVSFSILRVLNEAPQNLDQTLRYDSA